LHHEVQLPAARALARVLSSMAADTGQAASGELGRLAQQVRTALTTGKPWTVRGQLRALDGLLEPAILAALGALLDQCPSLVGALAADENGPPAPPHFIGTRAQLIRIRALIDRL
jgi:hypothetical protein